jgi:two-component system cell cycle sensor histidine kinase/response regulator CckA
VKKFRVNWASPVVGAVVGAFVVLSIGLVCLFSNGLLNRMVTTSSYDWSFDLSSFMQPDVHNSPVAIVYLDEDSYKWFNQPLNQPWDRALYAQLVDRLKEEGALAVVFDVVFSDPGPKAKADADLESALRRNGKVILAADYTYASSSLGDIDGAMYAKTMPIERFRVAAAGIGLASLQLEQDQDFLVRKHYAGLVDEDLPTLSWAAAELLKLPVAQNPQERQKERWVHYYGGPGIIPHVSYAQLAGVRRGFFHDKIVYVGARSMTAGYNQRRDELRNPYYHWSWDKSAFMPAVEAHATQTLNLIRGDSLREMPKVLEAAVLLASSLFFGVFLFKFRPFTATCVAILGALLFLAFALALFIWNVWFPWLIVVAFQVPVALIWCVVFKSLEWYTHRMQMEEERRVAHERIREQAALLDKAQDAILVHDLNWRVTYWNKSAERLYGLSTGDAVDKNVTDLITLGGMEKMEVAKTETLQHGEWTGELRQKTTSGVDMIVQSRWTLVRDDAGAPKSILVINTDITEQKKLESQFLRAQRMESIGTLAGGIAHDLNNVLSPIVMGTELLLKVEKDEKRLKLLRTMSSSAGRGADMVKQVLTFARGHEGERAPMQMTHILKEMQKIALETFPKSITMETRIATDAAMISGDATQIHQILLNLCVNARDAMPHGGKIVGEIANVTLDETLAKRIVGAKPGKYVVLSVSDTGTGIPPEIQDKIFEPFFTTKEVGKGTGLGLSTVISIIKGHGGFLELISEMGKGTAFRVYFPAVPAPAFSASATTSADRLRGNNDLILLVDDEPGILEMKRTILSEYGYRVMIAGHGAEAVELVRKHPEPFKLAIMDMMMPVMDGPTAIRTIKQFRPQMKFIAVSGLQQTDAIKNQLATYHIPFLSKPVGTEKLLSTLKKELSDSASSMAAAA